MRSVFHLTRAPGVFVGVPTLHSAARWSPVRVRRARAAASRAATPYRAVSGMENDHYRLNVIL